MAREAQQIHVAHFQQVRVWRAVRRVASRAAFDSYWLMFENKWAALIRVAGVAHGILLGRSAQLVRAHRSMRIVAIGALNQAFVYSMMKRHSELRFLLQVARVAKLGLRLYQQEFRRGGMVRRMA